ncbi:hypothetical protein CDAR_382051 [Caerostris darwini]|uniref:Uncharacterized protein n=1 Tax=Caerostris darwini TaxID=1538125 RepID=A0AAV4V5G5_9ARAC|nr:hypothetical protein CDAR_382051 [Caerostris darwini]
MLGHTWGELIDNVPGSRASSNESSTPTPFDQMIPRKRMEKTRSDSRSYHSPGGAGRLQKKKIELLPLPICENPAHAQSQHQTMWHK